MNTISAIIVLYNPNYICLEKLYLSVCTQVFNIIFVDNSSCEEQRKNNKKWVEQWNNQNNYYVSMQGNMGIATAQNAGIDFAQELHTDFILLLDQDSTLSPNMIDNLMVNYKQLAQNDKIAVVAPSFIDEKTQQYSKIFKRSRYLPKKIIPTGEKAIEVDYAIASGSLIHLDVFSQVGRLNDSLFIDWVDIEWCYRARQYGFKSYVIPQAIMQHSLGDEIIQDLNISLHSDFRNYFIVRNSLYLALYSKLPMNFRIIQLFKTPLYVLFYSYHSKKPFYSLKLLLIAVKDAMLKKMGKGYFVEKEI